MKYIGIVGHEAIKFTPAGERQARAEIWRILMEPDVTLVSGHCHLGGIDIWAEEEADKRGIPKIIFKPEVLAWDPPGAIGFKDRNIQIARQSDVLYCLAVIRLADKYRGMKFESCYHCGSDDHVKGGGCWTMKRARDWKRETHLIKIDNPEGP